LVALRFYFDLERLRKPLVGLGVGLEVRRTSGVMRFSPKTSKWTYGLEIGCTILSITVDVRPRAWAFSPECDNVFIFTKPSHSSCFLYSGVVLSRNKTNRKFSTNLENLDRSEFLETCYDPSEV
jgi:hypothetical protein